MLDDTVMSGPATGAGNGGGQAPAARWTVPGYTEVKKLGSGGFGDVVLARNDASGTQVAIKYLKAELLADPEFAESFRGEAAVLASLDDPNVVRLYEYVESPSGAAIVMELVDGLSLRQILKRQGATTPEAALVVLEGSLMGLAAAHERGVVHRDYKPDNVLIDGDGGSKLTDFGIAARAWDRPMPAGTLIYAPPEQFAGGPASPATDVYAATATFFECLAGRPPFRGNTAEALLYQHMSHPVPVDAVPEPVRPLVAAGLAKQPEDRPADAATFVAALKTIASGAYGPDWHERGRSHLGEAALLLAALWPSASPPAVQGTAVERTPLRQRKRRSRLRRPGAVKVAIAAGTVIVVAAAGTFLASALTRSHAAGLPAVTGVSPASGSTTGGTTVTITGTGLAGARAVHFGGVAGLITADSATRIRVTSPPSTGIVPITGSGSRTSGTGTVDITVTTPAGTSKTTAAGHYTYSSTSSSRAEFSQAISFMAPVPGPVGATAHLAATGGGSGSPVTFSVDPASDPGACTVFGASVTFTGVGRCVIDANQAGNGTYAAAPQVQQTVITPPQPTPVQVPEQANPAPVPTAVQPLPTTPTSTATTPTSTATTPPATTPPAGPPPAGATWTAAEGSLPGGGVSGGFAAMTCPSTSACVAVGVFTDSSGDGRAMVETGLGSSWTDAPLPLPSGGSDPILGGVACPSASECVAVGEYSDTSGHQHGLLLTGSRSSWTATEAPLPANASAPADPDTAPVNLYSVACASTSHCTAVGLYTDSSGHQQGLLLTGSGSSWTATEAPLPAGTDLNYYPYVSMVAVTCPSVTQCVAVG
ncbi:MAG: serine/threonine-protein kinase, partial [Streptosporangiaceae bacterium]